MVRLGLQIHSVTSWTSTSFLRYLEMPSHIEADVYGRIGSACAVIAIERIDRETDLVTFAVHFIITATVDKLQRLDESFTAN
jgi:hypothetical protein